jgi:hypothetical protein
MPVPWASGLSTSSIVTQVLLVINLVVFGAMALEGIAMDPNSRQLIEWARTSVHTRWVVSRGGC